MKKKRRKTPVQFSPEMREALFRYLMGYDSSRQAAKRVGRSHQTIINLSATFVQQLLWTRDLKFKKGYLEANSFEL